MEQFLKRLAKVVLIGGLVFVLLSVGWLFMRWTTAVAVFEYVRDDLRDSLGLSTTVAAVLAAGFGTIAALALTVLVVNARFLLAAGVAIVALGVPLALWHDTLSADQCFNLRTGRPLCQLWEQPEGGYSIRRTDGRQPGSNWRALRDATRGDVRAYLTTDGAGPVAPAARVPHPIALDSCVPWPVFFNAGGQAVVYFSREAGAIDLWDRKGPQPTSGEALKPMTSEVAKEVCAKLAAAKRQREEKLERERKNTLAAQQAAEQEAQQAAQRIRQDQEEAQRRQDQQQEDDRRAAAERQAAEQPAQQVQRMQQDQEGGHRVAAGQASSTLLLTNSDCRPADLYLDREKLATVAASTSQALPIQSGNHLVRVCQAGGWVCGQEVSVSTMNGPIRFVVNAQASCGYLPPLYAPRMPGPQYAMPAPLIGIGGANRHRNGSQPYWMVRR